MASSPSIRRRAPALRIPRPTTHSARALLETSNAHGRSGLVQSRLLGIARDHLPRLLVLLSLVITICLCAVLGSMAAGESSSAFPQPTLYRLKIDGSFPEPFFPKDNPLTEQGI